MARRVITKDLCFKAAEGCYNRNELQKLDGYLYKVMLKNGWLEEAFPCKNTKRPSYSEGQLQELASKFTTRNSFKFGEYNAYHCALRRGLLDRICSHMVTNHSSDKNVLYFLRAIFEGSEVLYKVGITSGRCKKRRLSELKYQSGVDFEVLFWRSTDLAEKLEKEVLAMGEKPQIAKFSGYSEIRSFNPEELEIIEDLFNRLEV